MININGDYYDLVIFYSYVTVNVYQRVKKKSLKIQVPSHGFHGTSSHRSPQVPRWDMEHQQYFKQPTRTILTRKTNRVLVDTD